MKYNVTHTSLLLLLPVLLLTCAAPLQARLGESPARLEARYGIPVKIENGMSSRDFQCSYQHHGINIVVHFLDEKSQYESYANSNGDPLEDNEIQRLLEVNQRGGKWKFMKDTGASKKWDLDSKEGTASYQYKSGYQLEIKTKWWEDYAAKCPAEIANGIKEKLKDF